MIEFCKEVVEAIKPLIQYEGDYSVNIKSLPIRDEEGKTISKHRSHVHIRPSKNDDEDYFVEVRLNASDREPTPYFMNRGFDVYLDNLGIEVNPHVVLVLSCLHEFGHVNMILECKAHGSINNYVSVIHINDNATKTIFPVEYRRTQHKEHKDSVKYRYSFDENYADKFALIHFMNVWNQVKHLV